jgi:hypothetical protein
MRLSKRNHKADHLRTRLKKMGKIPLWKKGRSATLSAYEKYFVTDEERALRENGRDVV